MTIGIYALRDQETKAVRYIGASVECERRFRFHRSDCTRPEKQAFTRKRAELHILEECTEGQLPVREAHWIELMRLIGEPLDLLRSHRARPALEGTTVGAWLVKGIAIDAPTQAGRRWLCECSCGTVRDVMEAALIRKTSRSCQRHRRSSCKPR